MEGKNLRKDLIMTTLLWFAELLIHTPLANQSTKDLYEGVKDQMDITHYTKWEEIG